MVLTKLHVSKANKRSRFFHRLVVNQVCERERNRKRTKKQYLNQSNKKLFFVIEHLVIYMFLPYNNFKTFI